MKLTSEIIKKLPKAELHCHLDGSLRIDTILNLASEQNIKLHKGSSNRASFSWVEGISMRSLDKNHVTPTLRKFDLLRLNQDGFMMTRSLAENYPYTSLYKANLRGARKEWMSIVEDLEEGASAPLETLKYLLSRLINAASAFYEKIGRASCRERV